MFESYKELVEKGPTSNEETLVKEHSELPVDKSVVKFKFKKKENHLEKGKTKGY